MLLYIKWAKHILSFYTRTKIKLRQNTVLYYTQQTTLPIFHPNFQEISKRQPHRKKIIVSHHFKWFDFSLYFILTNSHLLLTNTFMPSRLSLHYFSTTARTLNDNFCFLPRTVLNYITRGPLCKISYTQRRHNETNKTFSQINYLPIF